MPQLEDRKRVLPESKTLFYPASIFLSVASLLHVLPYTCENPASAAVPFLSGAFISEPLRELLSQVVLYSNTYAVSQNPISDAFFLYKLFDSFQNDSF